jgi:hypothetical protein
MTEAEWGACDDPVRMLRLLGGRQHGRKLRLLAVACCRRVLPPGGDDAVEAALAVAERFADGLAVKPQRRNAYDAVARRPDPQGIAAQALSKRASDAAVRSAVAAAHRAATAAVRHFREPAWRQVPERESIRQAERAGERAAQAALVRDIFGNPFRAVPLDPRWRTADVVGLALGIYEDGAFDRLPILADALLDAGCDNEQVIGHCRSEGPHVRGCRVVDLVLGKG